MSNKPFPDNLPEAMRPQPVPGLESCHFYASLSGLKNLESAVGAPAATIMARLLSGNIGVIEEAVARCVTNPDGSPWSGGADALPFPIMTLGQHLADAVHRRWHGTPLDMGDKP